METGQPGRGSVRRTAGSACPHLAGQWGRRAPADCSAGQSAVANGARLPSWAAWGGASSRRSRLRSPQNVRRLRLVPAAAGGSAQPPGSFQGFRRPREPGRVQGRRPIAGTEAACGGRDFRRAANPWQRRRRSRSPHKGSRPAGDLLEGQATGSDGDSGRDDSDGGRAGRAGESQASGAGCGRWGRAVTARCPGRRRSSAGCCTTRCMRS